ncbi:MAG: serine/threonine-protein kinase [Deltaproteobacteria bacterium]|nr:serine/threonine-protein kinase [Deltaproteobacteria bacterium]
MNDHTPPRHDAVPREIPLGSRPDRVDPIDAARTRVAAARALFGQTLPPVVVGRFEIRRTLGSGAMGRVFAAWDPRLERMVALKLINDEPDRPDPAAQQRLLREARALATVRHPHVVEVFEVGTFRDDVYLAMEQVPGDTLRLWLQASPRTPAEILEVFGQVAHGLAAIHRAGLVHRDVKPSNVLVDTKGRARVVDFGLARAPRSAAATPTATTSGEASVTATGKAAGTPAYMAPEQRHGEYGPAADQYALCVAIAEAITGTRPPVALSTTGPAPTLTAAPALSARLRRTLMRGLEPDPQRRFATMDALARALRPHRRPHTAAVTLAATGALAAGLVWMWPQPRERGVAQCDGAAQLQPTWNPKRRAAIGERLLEAAPSFGEQAWRSSADALDHYARGWTDAYARDCAAQAEASAPTSTTQCLHARLAALGEAIDLLERSDPEIIARVPKIVAGLPAVDQCSDDAQGPALPHDADQARRVQALRQQLDRVGVASDAADFERAQAIARAVLRDAEALGHAPLRAEALERLGAAVELAGDHAAATEILDRGYWLAQEAGYGAVAAKCATRLLSTAIDRAEFHEAERWAQHARAQIDRIGGDPIIEADLHRGLGFLAHRRDDLDGALAHHRQSQRREQQVLPADDIRHGITWTNIATIEASAGNHDEARRSYRRALELFEMLYGPEHPSAAGIRLNLASSDYDTGYIERAAAGYAQARRDLLAAYGPEHPTSLMATLNLGLTHLAQAKWREAEPLFEQALAIAQRLHGPDHPRLVTPLTGLAAVADRQGQTDRTLHLLRRGLRIREATLGADHRSVAETLTNITSTLLGASRNAAALVSAQRAAEVAARSAGVSDQMHADILDNLAVALARNGRWEEAAAYHDRAWQRLDRIGNPEHPKYTELLLHEAEGRRREGQDAEAVALLERALRRASGDSFHRPQIQFLLAAALWDTTDQQGRAVALARAALQELRAQHAAPALQDEVAGWLAQYGGESTPPDPGEGTTGAGASPR